MSDWYRISADMLARDLWTEVPLDWSDPDSERIRVFAREIADARLLRERADDAPVLVYLQGGPGGKGERPVARDPFLSAALKRFRVVMPDQRGTGRSWPVTAERFAALDAAEAAERLSLLRADSIVRDLEELRERHYGGRPWWTFGYSYGGFLTLHYLSTAPEAVIASAIAGGLPALQPDPVEVYERTFPRVRRKNREFYARFPHLVARVARIADLLQREEVRLPGGDWLTVRRLQTLGLDFGMGSGFDRVHWILDEAFEDAAETRLTPTFLEQVERATSFACEPLFMLLQESIYGAGPSDWAAQRVRERQPDFDESARPLLFTGEMAFPWVLDEIAGLRGFAEGARRLAEGHWPIELYDRERLRRNTVPIEAAVYFDDMYVDAGLSLATANEVGGVHAWVTNEFQHDGIFEGDVAERLFGALEVRLAQLGR